MAFDTSYADGQRRYVESLSKYARQFLGHMDKPDHEQFAELRQEIFGGKPLPGSSADLIGEAREIRDAETEGWA